ncbi:MAG: thiamine phosphate synthase [Burkholderiaceae bacterium]|nr:thiamine phosphate synthase [Burkholderiaceae bacterium]
MNEESIESMAQAILAAHQARVALPVSDTTATRYHHGDPVYCAVKQAARAMGFIDDDAECVALAWQARTLRTGRFDASTWPDEPADFGMAPHPRHEAFAPCPKALGLYAVLPTAAWVGRMASAGVPTVQLRFKSDDEAEVQREVDIAVEAVRGTGALLFINDHWQAAIRAGAYGVHLGQEDIDAADLKAIRSEGLRLGLSSHGYSEMLRVDRLSPSYIAMGAVYATNLKVMPTVPQGPGRLAVYARLMRDHSLVAIGGIDELRLPDVLASGVGSVAVVRALIAAEHPEAVAAKWKAVIGANDTARPVRHPQEP